MARFTVLSVLLHLWVVVSFGDASDTFGDASGTRRDGSEWNRTFVATLKPAERATLTGRAAAPRRRSNVDRETRQTDALAARPTPPSTEVAVPAPDSAAALEVAASEPPALPRFEKIPVLANDVEAAATPFVVAPIPMASVASPAAVTTLATPALATIASVPKVVGNEAGFAVFVAPIVERAAMAQAPAPMLATPSLPLLIRPTSEREFATYVAPPVIAPTAVVETRPSAASRAAPPPITAPLAASAPPTIRPNAPTPPVVALPAYSTVPIEPLTIAPASRAPDVYTPATPLRANTVPAEPQAAAVGRAGTAEITKAEADERTRLMATSVTDTAPTRVLPAQSGVVSGVGAPAILNLPLPLPAPAPTGPARAGPRLDLDTLRRQARDAGREGSGLRTLLPFATVAREAPKKEMEKIFDNALKRPDCKDAYADLGLAAVLPLARDALKDGGCKW